MENKTDWSLAIFFGIVGTVLLPVIFGPLAIYFGLRAKKRGFERAGTVSVILGIVALLLMLFSSMVVTSLALPFLGPLLGTSYPVTVALSESMEHGLHNGEICGQMFSSFSGSFEDWWGVCGHWYEEIGIGRTDFEEFPLKDGFNKGDLLLAKGVSYEELQVGEVVLVENQRGLVSHRIVKKYQENGINYIHTKGDHNKESIGGTLGEMEISEDQIVGKVMSVVPKVGLLKAWFT